MGKKHFTVDRLLRMMELPQDIDPHLLALHWVGRTDLLVEQHRGILQFTQETIRFNSEQGTMSITGSDLQMDRLTETRALIRGEIRAVSFED